MRMFVVVENLVQFRYCEIDSVLFGFVRFLGFFLVGEGVLLDFCCLFVCLFALSWFSLV